jgi:hypothetical protein
VDPARDRVLAVRVIGYLGADDTQRYLAAVDQEIEIATRGGKGAPVALLFLEQLTGFESLVVPRMHGEFFKSHGATVDQVAVVSSKPSVTFGLAVVKLIAPPKQKIKAFASEDEARRWLLKQAA